MSNLWSFPSLSLRPVDATVSQIPARVDSVSQPPAPWWLRITLSSGWTGSRSCSRSGSRSSTRSSAVWTFLDSAQIRTPLDRLSLVSRSDRNVTFLDTPGGCIGHSWPRLDSSNQGHCPTLVSCCSAIFLRLVAPPYRKIFLGPIRLRLRVLATHTKRHPYHSSYVVSRLLSVTRVPFRPAPIEEFFLVTGT